MKIREGGETNRTIEEIIGGQEEIIIDRIIERRDEENNKGYNPNYRGRNYEEENRRDGRNQHELKDNFK